MKEEYIREKKIKDKTEKDKREEWRKVWALLEIFQNINYMPCEEISRIRGQFYHVRK